VNTLRSIRPHIHTYTVVAVQSQATPPLAPESLAIYNEDVQHGIDVEPVFYYGCHARADLEHAVRSDGKVLLADLDLQLARCERADAQFS